MEHIDHFEEIPINAFKVVNATVLSVVKDLVHLKNPQAEISERSLLEMTRRTFPSLLPFNVIQKKALNNINTSCMTSPQTILNSLHLEVALTLLSARNYMSHLARMQQMVQLTQPAAFS